uniref:DNA-directed DNA polymerase n=1 Tax=Astyanax mexicanus TaxID=7994 RepID=A0A8B9JB99_ASTMX
MDSYPCSTLTAGPLSVAAQTVMAALRAQYAGRIHKSRHSELGTAIRDTDLEKQCLNHSPKLQLSNVADLSPFHSNINTLNRQKTDQLNLRLSDYSNGTSLLVLSADRKGTVAENNIPETDSHRKKTFLRTTFAYCGDPQLGTTTVVSQEQKHQEISSKTGKIQVMHPTKKESKAKRVTHSPPCKRWRSGHVQMPVVSCFKDFVEEEDNGLERAPAEQNCDESSGEKEVWYSEEKRNESTEIVCEEWDHLYNIGISEMVRFNLHWSEDLSEECCDEGLVCKSSPSQHNDLLISYQRQPVQTPTTQLELINKKEPRVDSRCDISKPSREKCSASEMNSHQRASEGDKKGDGTPASSKLTLALTCDSRVCDASRLSPEEKMGVLEEAGRARALVVTMVYQDGTTQLDPEQKATPAVCGLLVLLKKSLDALDLEQTETTEERLLFLRLEQRPVWAQQDPQHNQDLFTKEVLLQMVCGTQSLVCFKAKDLLRTALRHFNRDLSWKQVAGCQVLDPQIAAWLLDPADSACCFQDLLIKHCTRPANHTSAQPALGHSKVRVRMLMFICLESPILIFTSLQGIDQLCTQGLWQLYFCMEQKMIPVLAAMESHRIHVDKAALKKTSEMLGTKVKQLEQEAHQAAGQQFLVSSSAQLRLVLFEKLRLHKRCENKKLPKTVLKQQQSTSEAALLQLQDLHPLPKIILEYRQAHKIKSTFVDGILSCVTKSFISSTWNQTSTVSGRLSAKHPNFQALPKQPIQITKKQSVEGKESELVTVHPRTMFIPREGWSFLSADFCQVELRLLAHLSSDPELLRIFQNPEADVFTMLASQWKGVSKDTVSSEDREHAKRIVYSVVYGAGRERLSGILGVSSEEASRFQDTFLQTYREVQTFIQHTVQYCHKHGVMKSALFFFSGSAADLCKMAMIQICSHVSSSATLTARLVAQIHDELLFEVEDSQVEDFAVLVKKTMESLQHIDCLGVRLTVPLKVSVSKGRSWGSMCELSFPRAATHTSP